MSEPTLFDQLEVIPAIDRWHNTTDLQGQDLKDHKFQAGKLNRKVLTFFQTHSYSNFTPFEVWKALGVNSVIKSSVQRSMTDLTTMGYLVKWDGLDGRLKVQRPGQYKEKSYAWQIR